MITIYQGDALKVLKKLPDESVDCVVTSPPYWGLRDYGVEGQIGMESTLEIHVKNMVDLFREVRRVLKSSGVCWVNYGDCYVTTPNGTKAKDIKNDDRCFRDKPISTIGGVFKPKDLCMIPQRFAIAMQEDGWWLRSQIPWVKRQAMPESVTDRPATAIEYVFMFTKSARYYYNTEVVRMKAAESSVKRWKQDIDNQKGSSRGNGGNKSNGKMKAVGGLKKDKQRGHSRRHAGFNDRWDHMTKEEQQANGRNFRNSDLLYQSLEGCHGLISTYSGEPLALDVAPASFKEAHFATFPPKLVEPLIAAGCPDRGIVLDPFGGAGTTALVADRLGFDCILIELNEQYIEIAENRIRQDHGMFGKIEVIK